MGCPPSGAHIIHLSSDGAQAGFGPLVLGSGCFFGLVDRPERFFTPIGPRSISDNLLDPIWYN